MARAGLTAEKLVTAAARMADEIGFEQVTISALARAFDVQVASLYSHLESSNDLKTRIALLALADLAEKASEAVAGRAGKQALVALANVHRDFARKHPGLFAATQFRLDAETAAGSAGVKLAQLMRAVLRGYELGEPDQTHAVRILGSAFLGFTTLESAGSFSHSEPESEQSWVRMLDALDEMLRHWPRA
ncbi:TetR family transcriptional regulator [Devosia sp. H5989]|nr:TetR family transcriptional regulator [Devosia sp. H5989]